MARALTVNVGTVLNGFIINNLRFADDFVAVTEGEQTYLHIFVDWIIMESSRLGM